MRKTFVWAFVLVFALAGAVFAEDNGADARLDELEAAVDSIEADIASGLKLGGELKISADSDDSFTGPFKVTPSLSLSLSFAERAGQNWTANVNLANADLLNGGGFEASGYRGTMNGDGFDVTLVRNVAIGKVATAFDFVDMPNRNTADRVRFGTDIAGFDTKVELSTAHKDIIFLTEADFDDLTIGAGLAYDTEDGFDKSTIAGYVNTGFDIVDITAAAGQKEGDTIYGVSAKAAITDALSIDGEYKHVPADSWKVGASFSEDAIDLSASFDSNDDAKATFTHDDLIRVGGEYNVDSSVASVNVTYRGSKDNLAFGTGRNQLFNDGAYHNNVAPAFRADYTTDGNEIKLYAVAPLAEGLAAKAEVDVEGSDTAFDLKARYVASDKIIITPYMSYGTVLTVGSGLSYAIGSGADISLDAKSVDGDNSFGATFTVKF